MSSCERINPDFCEHKNTWGEFYSDQTWYFRQQGDNLKVDSYNDFKTVCKIKIGCSDCHSRYEMEDDSRFHKLPEWVQDQIRRVEKAIN